MSDVLLLHAGIADSRMWALQIAALETAGHRVSAPDLPGFGETPLEPGVVDYVGYAASFAPTPSVVVGCSFGGRIALELAVARPELVEKLVLVGAAHGSWVWSEAARAGFAEEEEAIERGDLAEAAAAQARMWLGADASAEVRALTEAMTLRSYELQIPVEDEVSAAWLEPPASERLDEVVAPTLVVVGSDDVPDILAIADLLTAGIPGARREVVEGAGHLPGLERPEGLNRVLLDFV
ncbi:MAG TPA: alpha/beta fold hydrolase [Gaiellaceae bacterium]|nr:alpha/beta fold hydrolase [Gaiellaceae bacterium]